MDSKNTLLELIRSRGIPFSAPCAGGRRCGGCAVRAYGGLDDAGADERAVLGERFELGYRLACRARVIGEVMVELQDGVDYCISSDTTFTSLGCAIDLGTTTLAMRLIDLETGGTVCQTAALNPQCAYGADVITRIAYAAEPGGLYRLRGAVCAKLSEMLSSMLGTLGRGFGDIESCVTVGNTTMLHILAGIDPSPMGCAPFEPLERFGRVISRSESGFPLDTFAPLCISGFIGADALAGMTALGGNFSDGDAFCDLGTNGELALCSGGRIFVCSAATGPALEGGCISCGSGGVTGAVCSVDFDRQGSAQYSVIGGGQPQSLCGSGLTDLIAGLLEAGVIAPSGYMQSPYRLAQLVTLTPGDVRQFQLAKGAVAAGLMRLSGIAAPPSRVILSGGLGERLRPESAGRVGLIPPQLGCAVESVPACALEGAAMLCRDRAAADDIADRCTVVPLDGDELFEQLYIENLEF